MKDNFCNGSVFSSLFLNSVKTLITNLIQDSIIVFSGWMKFILNAMIGLELFSESAVKEST